MQTAQAYRYITVEGEDDGAVTTVTMNRPDKRNALSLELMRELTAAFRAASTDARMRAVILRGEGPAFSAGHDLRELQCRSFEAYREIFSACVDLMQTIQTIPQPVIAEVAAVATAAGCQLVATCDLALAAPGATFATPGVRIGLFCTTPMVALTRSIGRKRAMEMLLTGAPIDAATAEQWGLVNRVVPGERLHDETLALARKIGKAGRSIVRLGKSAFYEQIDLPQARAYEFAAEVMTQNALEDDAQEGIGAFIEKRVPRWRD